MGRLPKPFWRIFLPLAALLVVGSGIFGQQEVDRQMTRLRSHQQITVEESSSALGHKLDSVAHDLTFLAHHHAMFEALSQASPQALAQLTHNFTVFSRSHRHYDQIRWIDETGMERVRVDFNQGTPVAVPAEQLQNKKQRYYFADTMQLRPGEFFVSPLDLNIEHGQIELPYKPMIRIATPVSTPGGKPRGIVILNYYGNDLLQAHAAATAGHDTPSMLLNTEGYWLRSPVAADEWGFMFKRPELSLAARSPTAWAAMRRADQGQTELPDGLWTWQTIYPLQARQKSSTGAAEAAAPSNRPVSGQQYFWKTATQITPAVLKALRLKVWAGILGITSLLLSLSALGCWLLARAWQRTEQAEFKYRTVSDFAYDWELWLGPDGKLNYCSPSCERITGHPAQDFLNDPDLLLSISHPEDRAQLERHHHADRQQTGPCTLMFRIVRPDGQVRWLEHLCRPVHDDHGLFLGRRASNRDITERKLAEDALEENREKFRALSEAAFEAIFISEKGRCLEQNSYARDMFGYSDAEAIGKFGTEFIAPQDHERVTKNMLSGHELPYEATALRKDGSTFPALICGRQMSYKGRNVRVTSLRDISEQKRAESELRIAATAFESQEGMMVTDADGNILRVNHAFSRVTGYSNEEVVGKQPDLLHSGRQDAAFYAAMWERLNHSGAWEGEIWNRRKSGEIYPEYLTIAAVKDTQGAVTHYVGTFTDITLNKSVEDEIRNLAFFDPLTALPNRRLLMDRLKHALASCSRTGRRGALLFIDMDNFKTLNDTLGHDMGDLLLQQVAQRLSACVREGDTVARFGGDEFVVMLEELDSGLAEAARDTETVGEKILATLDQPYQLSAHEYRSTPSIGATLFGDGAQSMDDLLKQADIAMYQAKKAGRDTLRFFDPQMQQIVNSRALLEGELRKALEAHQFELYYQLQVDGSRHPIGAEALIRWVHPEHGLVSPAQFIPLAEETGLILPIGLWVLETACAQIAEWQRSELTRHLMLAVNVSPKQFRQQSFVAQVKSAVSHHGIDPKLLKLELTESLLIENIDETVTTMNALNEIGVQFSLDDFGTGYSSLQYLKRLPLDQLKIDQSFIRDLGENESDNAIVSTVIAMAHNLNLEAIAEGVELEEQRQLLLSNGCTHYQGYLFGKPMPVTEFEALLRPEPTPQ